MRVEEMEKKMQKCAEDPKERMTTPQADGFFMPGEYEPHDGCIPVSYTHLTLPTTSRV